MCLVVAFILSIHAKINKVEEKYNWLGNIN